MAGISTIMRNLNRDIDEVLNNSGLAPCIIELILADKIRALRDMDERMYAMEQEEERKQREVVTDISEEPPAS